ncbi:PilC/PilY family type IV pilus protein [Zhongshania aquimaris]|uniref:PilC beta-propeller domain-containing protein n=1 Tax=Zhongshania aquimaris TaxID=2857107 RepID=A0ABS6VUN2_9GAMM|nr:PilC/PilY family type IV pilus protein [Zhongshania aquimaris]MBW2942036.1 hypothetical protein [Zhongshania aquimaris]
MNAFNHTMRTLISAVTFLFVSGGIAIAEDIDLFVGNTPSSEAQTVLLAWHTSGNVNANAVHGCVYSDNAGIPALGATTVGGMEQCAMVNAVLSLKADIDTLGALKVGLMVFNKNNLDTRFPNGTNLGNGNNGCGYLIIPPTLLTSAGIDAFVAKLKAIDSGVTANASEMGDMISESWAALNGLGASASCSGVNYSSLATAGGLCKDSVLVYIGNATAANASVKDGNNNPSGVLFNQLSSAFGYASGSAKYTNYSTIRNITGFNKNPANDYWGDEWAYFMHNVDVDDSAQSDRNVTTYSIAVYDPAVESQVAEELVFLREIATVGGGKPYQVTSTSHADLAAIFREIFNEVLDVNSVFSSATLPVSANTQGTFENQIYIAMFRPNPSGGPRWLGNVKQFQFGVDISGGIVLTDATNPTVNSQSIVNPVTGGLVDGAQSFWTTNTPSNQAQWPLDGFWKNSPEGDGFTFDAPDGDLVQKGGVAQMLRVDNLVNQDARRVYTCPIAGCVNNAALNEFKSSNSDLVSGLNAIISSAVSTVDSTITAGKQAQISGISNCTGGGNNFSCTYTYAVGSPTFNFATGTDRVVLGSGIAGSAKCTSAVPCQIDSASATQFVIKMGRNSGVASGTATFANANVTRLSSKINVNRLNHGLTSAQALQSCSVTGTNSAATLLNSSLITGASVATSSFINVDANNYTVSLGAGKYVYASSSAAVKCTGSTNSLNPSSIISWVRGEDNAANEQMPGPCSDGSCSLNVRGSIHGDVLHSRPAVVNYGGSIGVVVYYGANDGLYRAVNGNRSANISNSGNTVTVRPGGELWSFIAPEFVSQLPRQFNDNPAIRFPNTPASSNAQLRDYFFDGTTTFFQDTRTTGATAGHKYLYMSARRGGRLLYAMNVTDPMAPTVMWRLTTTQLPELGYTWSQPKVTKIGGRSRPVLIFGAGNSPGQDADPVVAADTMGRGIVILDGITGKIIWAALNNCAAVPAASFSTSGTEGVVGVCVTNSALTSAFPADITLLDRDGDGFTDRLYAADVASNIWRVDLDPSDSTNIYVNPVTTTPASEIILTKFATLGGSGNNARKMLYPPDVVPTEGFDLVVASTGDREHPLFNGSATAGTAHNVQNRFYMLIDPNEGASAAGFTAIVDSDLLNQTTLTCFNSSDLTGNSVSCDSSNDKTYVFDGSTSPYLGYYLNYSASEKGVNAPLTETGTVYFATNKPDSPTPGTCSNGLGRAFAYKVDILSGEVVKSEFAGGGLPPTAISGLVLLNGDVRYFLLGGDGDSIFKPSEGKPITSGRKRMFWYYK